MTNMTTHQKTLLHACCGPCSIEPSRILREDGFDIDIFYANSNIDPSDEYQHRLETLKTWADTEDICVIEGHYNHDAWKQAVRQAGLEHPGVRPERCRACYRLRFEEAAAYAVEHGYTRLSSTLSVSPYQYTGIIEEELRRAADAVGIQAEFRDFRPYYDAATEKSRNMGMYRQNYCGCELSDAEAQEEREERKKLRRAQKEHDRQQYEAQHGEELKAQQIEKERIIQEKQKYALKQSKKREILRALRMANKNEE